MRRRIDDDNSLYYQSLYPYRGGITKELRGGYRSILGIGGNIGDVRRRFNHLFVYLQKSRYIYLVETSPILKNPPFGYLNQDYFYNSIIFVRTCLKPKALLRYILRVEKRFGRRRSFPDAPRTLDIDILFYENIRLNSKELIIPHRAWRDRDSVTTPLSLMESPYIKSILRGER
ncbi:MAG: 2-amino-4-hydroxy-6-hydroxymethyldihydropteridine diphosphokinase [Epsilonproteobacteria bacterium]|nr:2-amino-4-hydroxy-6-hydroxymethyldihydropteridine diphosphokinase [Campylobacterota bacterium]